MAVMPNIPKDLKPTSWGGQGLSPSACVEHRTIGHWGGDYSVLSRGRVPSVHFLVGQDEGQWVQFWDTNWTAAHAAGANEYAVGIEFSGQNGENLTGWQLRAGGEIHRWLQAAHGIPAVFFDDGAGRVSFFRGFLNHSNVATTPQYTHYDYIRRDEWARMVSGGAPVVEDDGFMGYTPEQIVSMAASGTDRYLGSQGGQLRLQAAVIQAFKNSPELQQKVRDIVLWGLQDYPAAKLP